MKNIIKTVLSTILPFIIIVLGYIFYLNTRTIPKPLLDIIMYAPYVTFLAGSVIAWRFNRSRVLYILVILTLCLAVLQVTVDKSQQISGVFSIICLVIPLNAAIFSLLKERGTFSIWGFIRLGFILFQFLLSFWLINSGERYLLDFFNKDIFPFSLHSVTYIPQTSIIAFSLTFIMLILRRILYRSFQDTYFIALLTAILLALNNYNYQLLCSILFTVSGIILLVSLIHESYSMAFFDELTGLPSRRALRQDMMKLGIKYVIAMLDVDHFKKFNDTYGHDTGDQVLKLVASIIKDVKGGGKSFRYGGEEFTILFPGKSINDVLPHLEDLRETISKRGFAIRGKDRPKKKTKSKYKSKKPSQQKQIFITVSIGVSQKNENSNNPDSVLKSADTALYRAKKKGRNCVSK